MRSKLEIEKGIYDPTRRFAFTNIHNEPFDVQWDGKNLGTVQPGQTIELPHHLAVKCTCELVDRIMIEETKADEALHTSTAYYRSPKASRLGVPMARKPYEDKILKEIEIDPTTPQFKILASQAVEEIKRDLNAESSAAITSMAVPMDALAPLSPTMKDNIEEFPGLKKPGRPAKNA